MPWHIARVYATQAAPVHKAESVARIEPVRNDVRQPQAHPTEQLIAGAVEKKVDFTVVDAGERAQTASLAMYRHPADRNAAATVLHAGRTIDTTA